MRKVMMMLAGVLMSAAMSAQQDSISSEQPAGRKKVGVVLSGGGAKGMAHIGVLKVLEKAGIPVDIITGTSMGSIVGGLYAIGYNASALDSLVRNQDWSYVITDKESMEKQSLSDRKKQYTYLYSTGRAIGKGEKSPGGIIKGKNLAELFQRLCTGYTDSIDFTNDLRIPFACVATDIMDNSEIVFHSGRLPQAMRASMAIPAAFAPVRMGNRVLVDGGLRNNYPVDVAREMGADIVIGVTLTGKPKTAEDITNTMSIVGQIIDVNCVNKYKENIANTDLHMNVDSHGYSTASFSAEAIDSLIRYGEEEAMKHWDQIMALKQQIGVGDDFKPEIHQPLRPRVLTERQRVTGFTFENMTPQAERFLKQKFQLAKTDSIDAQLEQELTTSMRVDLFYNTAECRLEPEGDGVRVILSASSRKSVMLHAGVRFDTEEYVALQLGLELPLNTAIPMNTDVTIRLGKRMKAKAALTVHPRSFTRPTISYTFFRNDMDLYFEGERDYTILFNQSQAELTPINFDWKHVNFMMGVRWDYMHYRSQLGRGTMKDFSLENEHFFSYRAQMNYNSEDNWIFPTRGSSFKAVYAYLTDNFTQLDDKPGMSEVSANWRTSFTIGSRFTLQPMLYGRMLFGSTVPPVFRNVIGGEWFGHYIEQQMPFAGVGHMEYADHHFVAVQLQAQQRIGKNNYVLFRVAGAQKAAEVKNLLDTHTLLGGQIAYYYNTMFGPLGASLGYSNHTNSVHFLLNLGYEF
ncbi:MAG: patatin-like phospholipase family protein [Prevotella sp.]|nr:patatin-like phospholipase family protein [Prevotella sp.]